MTSQSLSEMVDRLTALISEEAAVFEDFLNLLGQQQEMLVKNDIDGLNRVTELQREKVTESQLLNKQREELITHIKSVNAIEGDLNITRLIELIDEERGNQLVRLRTIIKGLNTKINEVRNQNALLLNRSREYILRTMELLSKINNPDPGYSHNGAPVESGAAVAVDRRA